MDEDWNGLNGNASMTDKLYLLILILLIIVIFFGDIEIVEHMDNAKKKITKHIKKFKKK
jgi:hypothetical protein